jgi:hypothetical protein
MDRRHKEDLIKEYAFGILFDGFTIDRIRPELEERKIDDKFIREIIKEIDDIVLLNEVQIKLEKKRYQYQKSGLGILLTLLAILFYFSYSYGVFTIEELDFWIILLTLIVASYFFYRKVRTPRGKFLNKNKFRND